MAPSVCHRSDIFISSDKLKFQFSLIFLWAPIRWAPICAYIRSWRIPIYRYIKNLPSFFQKKNLGVGDLDILDLHNDVYETSISAVPMGASFFRQGTPNLWNHWICGCDELESVTNSVVIIKHEFSLSQCISIFNFPKKFLTFSRYHQRRLTLTAM